MSISPLATYNLQSGPSSALQALLARIQSRNSAQTTSTGSTGDQVSVSPIAQYLSQAPKAIAASLQDLVTARKDVTADLQALRTYYAANPKELTRLDAAMQLQSAHPTQAATMQAGVMDLYALSSEMGGTSGTEATPAELREAILAALDEDSADLQASLLETLNGTNQEAATGKDLYSLFSYLT